jgi:ubiquinone biosynthesis monooxygenase Coq7
MLRAAKTVSEKMIKVDHAGENGAVNIYRAQLIGARLVARNLVPEIRENQTHEQRHRRLFGDQLQRWGVRRCISYHLCGIGGFTLGLLTGFMGRQAIHATTYAVESVVLEHLRHQLEFLRKADEEAFHCVAMIIADEQEHHDNAATSLRQSQTMNKLLVFIVRLSTEGVIRFGMR